MTDVLIPFGNDFLALTPEQVREARERARALIPQPAAPALTPAADQVLDAEGMEKATDIPATWFLEQARRGTVPHLRAGKYVRFRLSETLEALRSEGRPTEQKTFSRNIRLASSRVK